MKLWILLLLTFAVALALGLLFGPIAISMLKRLKAGQSIREDGPTWHASKQGTPTIGGIIFILASIVASVIALVNVKDFTSVLIPSLSALTFAFVGFVDDYLKVVKKRNLGLKKMPKFLMQLVCAVALVISLDVAGVLQTSLFIPFFNVYWEMGIFYYPFAVFVVVAAVNAVNFTDGLDGLATCTSIPCFLALGALAYIKGLDGACVYTVALIGGLVAFLVFNFHPAKVFMGDTGSLYLGGAISALCLTYNMALLFLLIGIVFTIEMLCVVLQIFSFRCFGKRIFSITPIHHAFEKRGWSEVKIVALFTSVSIVFSVIGYFAFAV